MIIPNIWENKKWQPNHQPVIADEIPFSCMVKWSKPFDGAMDAIALERGWVNTVSHVRSLSA